jgi:hypothetical protein
VLGICFGFIVTVDLDPKILTGPFLGYRVDPFPNAYRESVMRFLVVDFSRGHICNQIHFFQRSDLSVSGGPDLPKLQVCNAEKCIFLHFYICVCGLAGFQDI